mgnify:CR=1 FL=1
MEEPFQLSLKNSMFNSLKMSRLFALTKLYLLLRSVVEYVFGLETSTW